MSASRKTWVSPTLIVHGAVEEITAQGTDKVTGFADVPLPEIAPGLTGSEPR